MSYRGGIARLQGLVVVAWLASAPAAVASAGDVCAYDVALLADGAVIASDGHDTAHPSVVRVPDWLAPEERAHPDARYYLYFGNHRGRFLRMKWAPSLEGPWTEFHLGGGWNGRTRRGVLDVDADPTRSGYSHVSAPDVHVDPDAKRFVMLFHGRNQPSVETSSGARAPRRHEQFAATSHSGLNFNDPAHAGGEPGYGPVTVTSEGVTRDVWIGKGYLRAFQVRGRWYGAGKRGILNAAPAVGSPWRARDGDPWGAAWQRGRKPSQRWLSEVSKLQPRYHSPAATFLASDAFARHPDNPKPGGRILSNAFAARMTHVGVHVLSDDRVELFFSVRSDEGDVYTGLYCLAYDTSAADFQDWTVARGEDGVEVFSQVATPAQIRGLVRAAHPAAAPEAFADPASLGASDVFVDADGSLFLFYSYSSVALGGIEGEGQISALRLYPADPDCVDELDQSE